MASRAELESRIVRLEEDRARLRAALCDSWRDIRAWLALAKSQRAMMDRNSDLFPPDDSVERSMKLLDSISDALRAGEYSPGG